MPTARFLLAPVAAILLLAVACGGETANNPPSTDESTRTPTPAAPLSYATIPAGSTCNARDVPADLDSFYCWALEVDGVLVAGSAAVDASTVNTAAETIAEMLAFRQDIRERLAGQSPKIIIVGPEEPITAAPELRHMNNSDLFDGRDYHSLRGWSGGVTGALGAEGVVGLAQTPAATADLLVHEFAHVMHALGLSPSEWTASHTLYSKSVATGLWDGTYASRNYFEFFAELTQIYFGVKGPGYEIAGPEELRHYDPEATAFLEKVYGPR